MTNRLDDKACRKEYKKVKVLKGIFILWQYD